MKPKFYIGSTIFGIFILLNLFDFTWGLELKVLDVFRGSHKPHPDIVILAIDNKSLQNIGRFPWDRKVYGELLKKLEGFKPRSVAFDINFSEPQNFENDRAFKMGLDSSSFPKILAAEAVYTKDSDLPQSFLKPVPYFYEKGSVTLGNVNVPESPDAISRQLPIALSVEGDTILPLSFELAKRAGVEPPRASNLMINFAGPAGSFPTFSVSDVLGGKIHKEDLQDKIALIGATASDLRDYIAVPVPGKIIAGIELHANALDNILLGRYIKTFSPKVPTLIGLSLGLIMLLLSLKLKTKNFAILFVALFIALPLSSFIFWQFEYALPYFLNTLFLSALYLGLSFYEWYQAELEKRRLRKTIQNHFSPQVIDVILKDPKLLKLGGERKEVTVMFSDIRSFTTISESIDPETLSSLLQEYFTEMAEEVLATDGVLDKFIGDAVMAFWGAPIPQADQADRAVKAALGMLRRLAVLQEKWKVLDWPFVDIGIGIHTGLATVGNMGSEKRFDYTVIGDTVNAASRLEGLNKDYKTHCIISEATKQKLTIPIESRPLGEATVKGKQQAINIFEVL